MTYVKKLGRQDFLSMAALIAITIIVGAMGFVQKPWANQKVIVSDARIYYSYLPAGLIYHDLTFNKSDELIRLFGKKWKNTASTGKKVVKMTMGTAVCWLPFFGIAHLYASFTDWNADGFSQPYHFMIFIAALFYLFLGLYYVRKMLAQFYDHITIAVVLVTIVLGTNLLYYVTDLPGMSHVISFSLISMFTYYSIKWTEYPTIKSSVICGIILGFITMVRPTNFIIVILPLIYWFFKYSGITLKLRFIKEHHIKIFLIIFFTILFFSPQMLYWKMQTDHFLYNSYHNEGFYFLDPNILDGLFSYRKGWFIYTPIMVFAVTGIFYISREQAALRYAIIGAFLIFVYVVFSWWCWWYGGSFGARAMIDIYGVMAIPLAALVSYILHKKIWIQVMLGSTFFFLIYLNLYQIEQYRRNLIHYDSMSEEAYWTIFLTVDKPGNYYELMDKPDYESAVKGGEE